MAVHAIDAASAGEMLRKHGDQTGRALFDVCEDLIRSHSLLVPQPPPRPPGP